MSLNYIESRYVLLYMMKLERKNGMNKWRGKRIPARTCSEVKRCPRSMRRYLRTGAGLAVNSRNRLGYLSDSGFCD